MRHAPRSRWTPSWPCTLLFGAATLAACLPPAGLRYPDLPRQEDGALHVIFFDVGQADATLVMYRGKSLLIDAGASREEPEKSAMRIPRRLEALLGSRHVDYLLLTHYHSDHVGTPGQVKGKRQPSGLYALMESEGVTADVLIDRGTFRVRTPKEEAAAERGDLREFREYQHALASWIANGRIREHRVVNAGDRIDLGPGLAIDVIGASGSGQLEKLQALFPTWMADYPPTENDYSIVLKLTLGDFELYTGGDLSGRNVLRRFGDNKQSYNDMESRLAATVGPVEVYHAHHHGSHNSSNECFLEVLRPRVSIITSGKNNFGHPTPEVYSALKKYGDVRIGSGADVKVRDKVAEDIVGDDIEVLVAPDGKRYWVNGRPYASRTEAEESADPNARASCDDRLSEERQVEGEAPKAPAGTESGD